ncbi:MAG TPA: hypothetical protein VEY09_01915 [Pyrinomonadaceae bacterium]|nr:hypothetical protein [Pyrinomonadaceae bacterium]
MIKPGRLVRLALLALALCTLAPGAAAQRARAAQADEAEFGPIVRAYLAYLRDQQEVVDDRVSRREIDRNYYVHNSNRIRALRQVAVRIARETGNDFLPELEAVSADEFDQIFFAPIPKVSDLVPGEVFDFKFRYLGAVRQGRETFHVFARLDPYEQAELRKQQRRGAQGSGAHASSKEAGEDGNVRPRRVNAPR